MKKAVIETGGKQYFVEEGTVLYVEKLDANAGDKVVFDKVLMANGITGRPYVKSAKVTAEVIKHGKQKKIVKNKDIVNLIQKLKLKKLKHSYD